MCMLLMEKNFLNIYLKLICKIRSNQERNIRSNVTLKRTKLNSFDTYM